jgi:DNA polymerase-4
VERDVIHLNVADFAVAVERALDRRLQDRPVIVAPAGVSRAVVYDMSEEAYQAGVRKGMALRRAVRMCADARILPPHPARYEQAMQALIRQARPYSPLIEPGEADGHLFMDVTGTGRLFGPPADVAWRLRRRARREMGLMPVWAVAPNKLVAKVATRLVKPDGEFIVRTGEEGRFLAPVPLNLVPGIEHRDLVRLADFNFRRAGQVAALGPEALQVVFGARALDLFELVQGIDRSPVRPVGQRPPRVVRDHDFGQDAQAAPVVEGALYALVEDAGRLLRQQCLAARRVAVWLDYSDGRRCARQRALRPASANDWALFEQARAALDLAWRRRVRLRHLRLVCDRLVFPPLQRNLFPAEAARQDRQQRLVAALDGIRARFGVEAIRFARLTAS